MPPTPDNLKTTIVDRPEELLSQLAFFLGPMAENSEVFSDQLHTIIDDYCHWRRNYFPQDAALMTSRDRRVFAEGTDQLSDGLRRLLALLRRSFPFHNPRYVAHQQSETSMLTLLGSIAGLLYNSNNVTPESGNATLLMEMEAASALLKMIGYAAPPTPPEPLTASREQLQAYFAALKKPYGWCHLCSGGTSANMEALWMARNVRYRSLAIAAASLELKFQLSFTPAGRSDPMSTSDLGAMSPDQRADTMLGLRPDEAIRLHGAFFAEAKRKGIEKAWDIVTRMESPGSDRSNPWYNLKANDQPVVLVSGAAHYSVNKSLNVLGLGRESMEVVKTDSRFRLDIADLRSRLQSLGTRRPLAVVGIVGTTEEGAIDPIDGILELRKEWERDHHQSFWVHADAAWGGYFLTALRPTPSESFAQWGTAVAKSINGQRKNTTATVGPPDSSKVTAHAFLRGLGTVAESQAGSSGRTLDAAHAAVTAGRWAEAQTLVEQFLEHIDFSIDPGKDSDDPLASSTKRFMAHPPTRDAMVKSPGSTPQPVTLTRALDHDTVIALARVGDADSVTVDPHKMGFQPYACGAIAFKSDGTRDFVRQSAPYITSLAGDDVVRQPLLHLERTDANDKTNAQWVRKIDAPALFTLEGSRSSAPATGLWLSTQLLTLDRAGHGPLVRSTWRAANDLFSWIDQFDRYRDQLDVNAHGAIIDFEVLTRSGTRASHPDTNLVIFGATVRSPEIEFTLSTYDKLMQGIYERFSISAEHGDERHSYAQPFFLSRTPFSAPNYDIDAVRPAAEALGISDFREAYSSGAELMVLRSTVMNPYLESVAKRADGVEPLNELMTHLYRAAADTWKGIVDRKKAAARAEATTE